MHANESKYGQNKTPDIFRIVRLIMRQTIPHNFASLTVACHIKMRLLVNACDNKSYYSNREVLNYSGSWERGEVVESHFQEHSKRSLWDCEPVIWLATPLG
ncbi:hypothetical protein AVEN_133361-1 [Araneus ventricosus]|uniref:Uncharacterized protein n=1 Tax=Araneus ventricosus TaxID=182803 RepID=A0A4Y2DLP2_ARAVE|nr:hypothetical protein AVEN_133361-1 [Araneus ventricosus]